MVWIFPVDVGKSALKTEHVLQPLLAEVWRVTQALAPFLLLGTGIAAILHRFVPTNLVQRNLTGRFGVLRAVLLGIPLPLCSCGVIPAAIGLKKQGASDGATTGFLISTPQTGVDSISVAGAMLGWPFALFKVVTAIALGLLGGSLVSGAQPSTPSPDQEAPRTLRGSVDHAVAIFSSIWKWLIFGILVSALLNLVLPNTNIGSFAHRHQTLVIFLTFVISTPLYVCATASVPIAAALVAGGFPIGAALVFLMAGPATNTATIGAVFQTLGMRTLLIYLSTVIVGSLGFAFIAPLVLPPITPMLPTAEHSGGFLSELSAAILFVCFAFFLQRSLRGLVKRKGQALQVSVSGMTCGGCVAKLERALNQLPDVQSVWVDLDTGVANVDGEADMHSLIEVIERCGFAGSPLPNKQNS